MMRPLVSVLCLCYNHARYIERALQGMAMQQTSFPVEFIIHDDASTDGSAGIIAQFIRQDSRFSAILQTENQYLKYHGFSFLKNIVLHGKYVATCEGDDFWTDPQKLARQVQYMESTPDCALSFHKVTTLCEWEPEYIDTTFDHLEERDYSIREITEKWTVPTVSILCRSQCWQQQPMSTKFLCADLILALTAARLGKIHCLAENMATYYKLDTGMVKSFNFNLESAKRQREHFREIASFFPEVSDICRNCQINNFCTTIRFVLKNHNILSGIKVIRTEGWLADPLFYRAILKGIKKVFQKEA